MKAVYKYELKVKDSQYVSMPRNAEILTVQMQHDIPIIWALVDTEESVGVIDIEIYGTGHPIPDSKREYIGTFQVNNGFLVWHVFKMLLP